MVCPLRALPSACYSYDMSKPAALIIGSSEKDSDLFYATKFIAPDPFIFVEIRNKKYLLANDLEIDRAKKQAAVHAVVSTSVLSKAYSAKFKKAAPLEEKLFWFLKKHRVKSLIIPADFPVRYYEPLKRAGFRIRYKNPPFYEKRSIKNRYEIAAIKQALRATEYAVAKAIQVLKKSVIKKNRLYYKSKLLTSEFLKTVIHRSLLEKSCIGEHTIVSCGQQTIDPHHRGSGPLYAHQPIIMDVFPRHEQTLYYADFTRTIVRGKASPVLKRMYAAVKEGQKIAFQMIRAGMDGKKVHAAIQERFSQSGFQTGNMGGRMQGFFHSTGHGLGLDIHEPPRIGAATDILKAGQVVTVEPGLYYKGIGGVRLEDVVLVTKKGCTHLTKFPKHLEI